MTPFEFFVPGLLKNYANAGGYYSGPAEAAYRKRWRTAVQAAAIAERNRGPWTEEDARRRKRVLLHAYVWNLFDSQDGLRNALKPVPDGLVKARLLDDDADRSGHVFEYSQEIKRRVSEVRGVRIRVELLSP